MAPLLRSFFIIKFVSDRSERGNSTVASLPVAFRKQKRTKNSPFASSSMVDEALSLGVKDFIFGGPFLVCRPCNGCACTGCTRV